MKYFKRAGIYKASNLDFNPETGLGHSYSWYQISKTIKGYLVLNTYNYSATTLKHHNKLWRLMKSLGLEFITIEAPRGLQSLDSAQQQAAYLMAQALVKQKYARSSTAWQWDLKRAEENITNLAKIGVKVPQKLIKEQTAIVESLRANELQRKRRLRAANKPVEVVFVDGAA